MRQSFSKCSNTIYIHNPAKPIAAVGLDLDDTLIEARTKQRYDVNARRNALHRLINEDGYSPLSKISWDDQIDFVTEKTTFLYNIFGNDQAVEKGLEYIKEYYANLISNGEVLEIEGARETLRFLRDQRIPFFVASNNPTKRLQERFQHFFGREFPDTVLIGTDEFIPTKPDPRMIQRGFEKLGVNPETENTFYIGNGIATDVPAAIYAGTKPILFRDKQKRPEQGIKNLDIMVVHENDIVRAIKLDDAEYPVTYAENHQQVRSQLFSFKASRIDKKYWWEGEWWQNTNVLDDLISFAHELTTDDSLKDHHLIMLGGATSWLSFVSSQLCASQDRLILNLPFSTKNSPIELKRTGFYCNENAIAKFVTQPFPDDVSFSEKEQSYRKLLTLCRLDPVRIVKHYRATGKKFAFIDCIGKGKGPPTFMHFMIKWAQEEAQRRDEAFLEDFMVAVQPVAIAAEPHYRRGKTEDYEPFNTFIIEGCDVIGDQTIPIKTYVNSTCKMFGSAKYPRLSPKYPYDDWSNQPYFKNSKSWLEEKLINKILGIISDRITRFFSEETNASLRTWDEYVKSTRINIDVLLIRTPASEIQSPRATTRTPTLQPSTNDDNQSPTPVL